MLNTSSAIEIQIQENSGTMVIKYNPQTDRTIYDLCDLNGRVIQTGPIHQEETVLDISSLSARKYVMLIVDGDRVISQRVTLAA